MPEKEKILRAGKRFLFILILLLPFLYWFSGRPLYETTITITYAPWGTAQNEAYLQFYQEDVLSRNETEIKKFQAVFVIDNIKNISDLSLKVGDQSGTVQIETITLKNRLHSIRLSPGKIADSFEIREAYTVKNEKEYLEIFTYDISLTELKLSEDCLRTLGSVPSDFWRRLINTAGLEIGILIIFVSVKRKKYFEKLSPKITVLLKHMIPFLFAFLWCFSCLMTFDNMTEDSQDAQNIWKTITSYYSDDMYVSYVLYKGFFSVFPYVWLRQLAVLLHCGEFFFIKIFHSLIFAYISAVGFPAILESTTDRKAAVRQKIFYIGLIFCLQRFNLSYNTLLIDLPYLFWFTLMLHIYTMLKHEASCSFGKYLLLGLSIGCCTCFTGQYKFAAVLTGGMALYDLVRLHSSLKKAPKTGRAVILFIMILITLSAEAAFQKEVVEPLRQREDTWLPTASSLVQYQFSKADPNSIYGYKGLAIKDYQIMAIAETENPQYAELSETPEILAEYLRVGLKHPGEFLVSFANKFFMVFACDNGGFSLFYYWLSYSLLFCGLWVLYRNKTILKTKKHILILILLSAAVPCITHVEPRYVMAAQNFMFGLVIFDDGFRNEVGIAVRRFQCKVFGKGLMPIESNQWTLWTTFI